MFSFITLCALLAAFVATFLYYIKTGSFSGAGTVGPLEAITFTLANSVAGTSSDPVARIADFTNIVGAIWAVCFGILGVRYFTAFRLTHKLRTTGTQPLPSDWQRRFTRLIKTSNASHKVRAYISDHVSGPITFGFFKPVILVPAWFFTGLSTEQCEAIFLHEIAHIKRHDYLTNIIEVFVKTVFFYHPAVQYMCKTIDVDREHACDDFAVHITQNPQILAKALGAVRIHGAQNGSVFALSADGKDAPLMHRLKRLMGTPIHKGKVGTLRGLTATLMLVSTTTLVMIAGPVQSNAHPVKTEQSSARGTEDLAGKPTPPSTNYWVSDQDWQANEERIERANERRQEAWERAQEQRERTREHQEATRERAEEQRERIWERAQEQREHVQEQREHAREHQEEARERRQGHEKRAKKQQKKQQKKFEEMRARLIPVLQADGFMDANQTKKIVLEMTSTDIFINGRKLPDNQEEKYCDIVSDYIERKSSIKRIKIKPKYFSISIKNPDGHTNHNYNYTYNN